jgi:hypothetical protein
MATFKPGKYVSDFSEFHHKRLDSKMTLIDLDLAQYKIMNDGRERIRLIEYKGTYEEIRKMQLLLLNKFANYFSFLNDFAKNTKFEVLMIKADFRENKLKGDVATIYNFIEKKTIQVDENELISFLEYTKEWEDLIGKKI